MKTHMTVTGVGGTYSVVSSAACMPSSCWGKYRRIAILELTSGDTKPGMISERAKGVKLIVETWEKLNCGLTKRCAFERALGRAIDKARHLSVSAT